MKRDAETRINGDLHSSLAASSLTLREKKMKQRHNNTDKGKRAPALDLLDVVNAPKHRQIYLLIWGVKIGATNPGFKFWMGPLAVPPSGYNGGLLVKYSYSPSRFTSISGHKFISK